MYSVLAMATPVVAPQKSSDVAVYARHIPGCKNIGPKNLKNCTCPKWLYVKATQKRISARTIYWGTAEQEAQKIRDLYDPKLQRIAELEKKKESTTVQTDDAIEKWIADKRKNNARASTIEAYNGSLKQFLSFARSRNVSYLHDVTPALLTDWKAAWPDKAIASMRKKRSHTLNFFRFCVNQKWVELRDNPALALTRIIGEDRISALPFMADQYDAILDATYIYDNSLRTVNRLECQDGGARLRGLIQLMRWSGLAIRDAATLERHRIDEKGVLKVRRTKSNDHSRVWVILPLPPKVVEDLRALSSSNDAYFFWSGTSKPRGLVGNFNRSLARLWKLVKWPRPLVDVDHNPVNPHSHMLRHSFAYHFLQSGQGEIRDLARLLGHTSIRTTEKYYLNFVPDESEELNEKVRRSWAVLGAPGFEKRADPPQPPSPEHRVRIPIRRTRA
jgi:site-specific recombinase XerD